MAKGIGLIGNFRGKVGNMVGYNLKDSNNKQTQGVRVYQPVVKNPKTAGQAEQRAKLAPINATYRALKSIIDRGQEGKAYGNKSRLAWLSDAMKAFNGGWFQKGAAITAPALVPLTKGSLGVIDGIDTDIASANLNVTGVTAAGTTTIGALSTALIAEYRFLKDGDQLTFIVIKQNSDFIDARFDSFVIDTTSASALPSFILIEDGNIKFFNSDAASIACTVIASREGNNGAHLRSTANLVQLPDFPEEVMGAAAKTAAVESYMSAGANTDWAEESLQD